MKICMIGHKYVPSREGGVEIVVENLATRMVEKGNEVTLYNRKRKQYKKIDEYKGCHIENVFTVNKKSLDAVISAFFATLKVKKEAKKGKYDVVHFHAEGPCLFLNLLPRRKKRKYKVVVTIHGLDWKRGKWGGFASRIIKIGEKKAVKFADEIIVLSKGNQEYFKNAYNRETVLIPNGVNTPILHEPEIIKQKYNLENNSYVLFLARIVPEKGVHYLIDAWKKVKEETNTDLKLVIAGGDSHSGEYFSEMMNKVKDDDSIITTGLVEGQTLQELFSNSYLYVLPSDIEGMPMSLLEALSYGNICLVSDIRENKDVIDEKSYTFKHSDVNDLKDKLEKIINLNLETHKNQVIPYTWDMVVEKTLKEYKR